MQFNCKRSNLFCFVFLFLTISCSLFAEKTKSSLVIKQVSKECIQKHARHIRGVMSRRSILMKVGIAGMAGYGLYTLGSWFRSKGNNGAQKPNNNEPVSREEFERLNNLVRQYHNNSNGRKTGLQKTWDTCKRTGKTIFQWIGVPMLIGAMSNKFHRFMGFTQSIDIYDQNVTHCMELLQYLVYNIQEVADFINRTGQQINIDKKDFVITINRLITSVEKMIGFIDAKRNTFKYRLKKEAGALGKRLTEYAQEFAENLHDELKNATTDFRQIAQTVARFGQRYAQEKQRFALIEQEAQ